MIKEFNVKEIFSFDEKIYKEKSSKNKNKKIASILINLLIIITCICLYFVLLKTKNSNSDLIGIIIIICLMPFVSFFILLYQIISLTSSNTLNNTLFTDRFYVLTEDNKFLSLKFKRGGKTYRLISDPIARASLLQNDIINENKGFVEKIYDESIKGNDLLECLEIINVYKITENEEKIKIQCDYNDLVSNTGCKNTTITIYKYFSDYDKLIKILKKRIGQKLRQINNKNGEHRGFTSFILRLCKNKTNWFFYFFGIFGAYGAGIGIICLLSLLYFESKAIKFLDKEELEEKELINKKRKFDILFIIIDILIIILFCILSKK